MHERSYASLLWHRTTPVAPALLLQLLPLAAVAARGCSYVLLTQSACYKNSKFIF